MSPIQRFLLLSLAGIVALGAFLLLRTDDAPPERAASRDEQSAAPTSTAEESTMSTETETDTESEEAATTTTERERRPRAERVRVRGGAPVGGVERIRAGRGETVRIAVSADAPDEVHLHGYDIERPVGPGKTARLRFRADLEGIFELELHGSGTQIAEVEVRPR